MATTATRTMATADAAPRALAAAIAALASGRQGT
jgi:hypothetical protein